MEIDLGAIAKEYAADRAAAVCSARGIAHGLVDVGGDLCTVGPHPDGRAWRIDLRHPRIPDAAMAVMPVDDGAVASSGCRERRVDDDGPRFGRVLDPATGWPSRGLAAVSVMADRCLVAGSIATIAMLRGREGIDYLRDLGVRHVWIDDQGHVGGTLGVDRAAPDRRT